MRKQAFLFGAVLALAACATDIDQDDYIRSCAAASECVVIFQGDPCGCGCDYGAINASEEPKYLGDRSGECSDPVDCGACPGATAACTDGLCVAVLDQVTP